MPSFMSNPPVREEYVYANTDPRRFHTLAWSYAVAHKDTIRSRDALVTAFAKNQGITSTESNIAIQVMQDLHPQGLSRFGLFYLVPGQPLVEAATRTE